MAAVWEYYSYWRSWAREIPNHVNFQLGLDGMYSTILYGARVQSDRPLMEGMDFESAFASKPRYILNLFEAENSSEFRNLNVCTEIQSSHGREIMLHSDREFATSVNHQPWCFEVKNVASFYWTSGTDIVYYTLIRDGEYENFVFWFAHIFLPVFFALEKRADFLHAGAVEVDEKPVLFMAPSTGGKSALTSHFLERGHNLISDDKVLTYAQDDRFFVVPSHPYYRPYRQFEDLGYRADRMLDCAKPIHAIYSLERSEKKEVIEVAEITGFRKFEILYPNYLYDLKFMVDRRFQFLSGLIDSVPVYRIDRSWGMELIADTYEVIASHARSLPDK